MLIWISSINTSHGQASLIQIYTDYCGKAKSTSSHQNLVIKSGQLLWCCSPEYWTFSHRQCKEIWAVQCSHWLDVQCSMLFNVSNDWVFNVQCFQCDWDPLCSHLPTASSVLSTSNANCLLGEWFWQTALCITSMGLGTAICYSYPP